MNWKTLTGALTDFFTIDSRGIVSVDFHQIYLFLCLPISLFIIALCIFPVQRSGLLVCSSQNCPCKVFLKMSVISCCFPVLCCETGLLNKLLFKPKLVVINFMSEYFWSFWIKKKKFLPLDLLEFELLVFSETSSQTFCFAIHLSCSFLIQDYLGVKTFWLVMCMLIPISQLTFCDALIINDFWSMNFL